ncbi:uncharacterized protein B0T23DRAFT_433381 [Neurospora hispaniola]|uniref:Uncharacterized protein n=1 Tax=Neurospora hispaniola TaxID=588809 RepID=A0AAJ0HXZ9_9PEZI|nr:hypothetical protein B0T23DRAFT_433381 [Neurospora hispaniola]
MATATTTASHITQTVSRSSAIKRKQAPPFPTHGFLDCIPKAVGEKKKKKRKYRRYAALGPCFQSKNNAPAWGSASTTELENLLDADGSVEGKDDDDYEADEEESVYSEDDSMSTISTYSTPEYSGEWKQPEKQILVEVGDWNWKPVNINDW